MGPSDRGFDDGLDDAVTEICRQCGDAVIVRADDEQPDWQPFVCDPCLRTTVNRATNRSPLSDHIFETAVEMARVRR